MLFSLVGVVFGDGREHFVRVSCSHEPKLWIYNPPPPKKKLDIRRRHGIQINGEQRNNKT